MFIPKRLFLSIHLASLVCCSSLSFAATTNASNTTNYNAATSLSDAFHAIAPVSFSVGLLYVRPYSDNLRYATFVSGTQPYDQSWHYQEISPSYHPAFDLSLGWTIPNTAFNANVQWVHLNTNDHSSKQASNLVSLSNVEFVGPPYEMSPPVFGIKAVNSKVNFNFDNVLLNAGRTFNLDSHFSGNIVGGVSLLKVNQTITTTFGDYAGALPTAYSYPLPSDPTFSFQTQNVSKYFGAGPDIGLNVQYQTDSGFGVMAQFVGMVTAGTIKAQDNFTSTSARLTSVGIGTSHQQITTPNVTQIVLGLDGEIGLFYHYRNFGVTAGYRIVSYLNAISTIMPNTLVQPGTVVVTPEFSTGTMAIVSTNATSHPFSYNGPFINFNLSIA